MNEYKPIDIDKTFQEALDVLIVLLGGIQAPLLCSKEIQSSLAISPFMTYLDSSVRDQVHIPKEYWFDIANNPQRRQSVIINGCQSIASLAFEKLKLHPKYDVLKGNDLVRVLGHLRNSGSHGNKFWFKNRKGETVDPGIILWCNKTIDISLDEKQDVFPTFFSPGDFLHLFNDISKLIRVSD